MKPLSEWTMGDLYIRLAGESYPTPTHPAADVLAELLRRERKRCADEVARMVGRWDESGGADDALSVAASRIRGLQ